MSDWPPPRPLSQQAGGVISTASILNSLQFTQGASNAWPSANLAIFVPFRLAEPVTVCKLAVGAGATAAGNFDVGIFDAQGNRIVSSGATAKQSSVEQIIDITDTEIGPGVYYLALAANGTNNYTTLVPSGVVPIPIQKTRLYGVVHAAASYVLPASVTFTAATFSSIPMIAAYLRGY